MAEVPALTTPSEIAPSLSSPVIVPKQGHPQQEAFFDDFEHTVTFLSMKMAYIEVKLANIAARSSRCSKKIPPFLIGASHGMLDIFRELEVLSGLLHANESLANGDPAEDIYRSIASLRNLFKLAKYQFERLSEHICTPIKFRGAACQHLHGFSRLVASLSSLFPQTAKRAASLQIMIVSREFRDAFEKFYKWCRRFFDELQGIMDAHQGFVALTPDEAARVLYRIGQLLWIEPMSRYRRALAEASDR
ncbi:hypothetical protein GGG16DRAFT_118668 [Schizophyllum commune]|nr:hypothetical protein K525DRAFT_271275 [Schizophyllum commune Loenen D]